MAHNLLLVTTTSESTTSAEVRQEVTDRLASDPSFIGGDTPYLFYMHPLCDYFSVGGYFSGYLVGEEDQQDYVKGGIDDDAMIITPELWEQHLHLWEWQEDASSQWVDLQQKQLGADFIGRKWLVVVDFHQ